MRPAPKPLLHPLPSIDNLRDLGGRPAFGGRPIKKGLLFRSAELSRATDSDLRYLERLGIRLVVDFRELDEVEARPDRLPRGAAYRHLPALPLNWAREDVPDSHLLAHFFKTDVHRFFLTFSLILANSEETAGIYAEFFRLLEEARGRPVLWHCTQGKDRAGIAAVLLQTALGVSWEGCLEDYFLTNVMAQPELDRIWEEHHDEEELHRLQLMNLASLDCIEGWRRQLTKKWGGPEAYLEKGLGLDESRLARLRRLYLER